MAQPLDLSASRTYPLSPQQACDAVLPMPLASLFSRRYALLPPIRDVQGERGEWGQVGQTRTIRLAGGGSMREELISVERPRSFGYEISAVTGPLAPLARRIEGRWSFDPAGTGTRVTWEWRLHPASALAAPALPVFARMWRGYAARALARLEELLVPA